VSSFLTAHQHKIGHNSAINGQKHLIYVTKEKDKNLV